MSTFKVGDLEKWQPKEGEWCWYLYDRNNSPYLKQYYQVQFDTGAKAIIEPFIGELPSFLKDK